MEIMPGLSSGTSESVEALYMHLVSRSLTLTRKTGESLVVLAYWVGGSADFVIRQSLEARACFLVIMVVALRGTYVPWAMRYSLVPRLLFTERESTDPALLVHSKASVSLY